MRLAAFGLGAADLERAADLAVESPYPNPAPVTRDGVRALLAGRLRGPPPGSLRMRMTEAFICDALRTPIGRYGGALATVRADDLAAVPLRALLARHPELDPAAIDDVILGCANQAGEDNRNVARMALLLAGPAGERAGRHRQPAVRLGHGGDRPARRARSRRARPSSMIAGGVESMTRAPFVLRQGARAPSRARPRSTTRRSAGASSTRC